MRRFPPCGRVPPAFWVLAAILAGSAGCGLFSRSGIRGPMSYRDQEAAITKIAPYGTERQAAISKLQQAGIVGEFSQVGNSIFYCQLWERSNGERWHMSVALLFDARGKLYAINPSDSAVVPDDQPPRRGDPSLPEEPTAPPLPAKQRSSPISWPAEKKSPADEGASRNPRLGHRSPFAADDGPP